LLAPTSEEFVHLLTDNLPARPEYFARKWICTGGCSALVGVAVAGRVDRAGSSAVAEGGRGRSGYAAADAVRRDARAGFGSHALTGQFASWAARIVGLDARLIIAGEDPEHLRESQLRLACVGVESVAGYLADGAAGWIKNGFELNYIPQITAQEFVELQEREPGPIAGLDVREGSDRAVRAHPPGTTGVPDGPTGPREPSGGLLQERLSQFDRHQLAATLPTSAISRTGSAGSTRGRRLDFLT
jgi:hypothetical protein